MADYVSHTIRKAGSWAGAFELCVMSYDERFLRRKVVTTVHNETILVDLPKTTHLDDRDAFELTDGRLIEIIAAEEDLYVVSSENLAALAWHIGNRHTPCQINQTDLYIQRDPVLLKMLEGLGARVDEIHRAFTPEGGAYGHGRTHGHSHSDIHGHGHDTGHHHHDH